MLDRETILNMTPSQIRAHYREDGHFFDRKTLRFFGDTMKSFAAITHNGERYLYRRPDATVTIAGKQRQAGRDHFIARHVVAHGEDEIDLKPVSEELKAALYSAVTGQ
jgi:hypothetical protein